MKNRMTLIALALATLSIAAQAQGPVRAGTQAGAARAAAIPAPRIVLPEAVNTINFDSISAPSLFSETTALAAVGAVLFNGSSTSALNGGAVLDDLSSFGVTGYSAPNFLAFNCEASMLDGGVPKAPQTIQFPTEVRSVSLKIGSGISTGTMVLWGIGSGGAERKSLSVSAGMATVSFKKPLTHILIASAPCTFVLDDIVYTN